MSEHTKGPIKGAAKARHGVYGPCYAPEPKNGLEGATRAPDAADHLTSEQSAALVKERADKASWAEHCKNSRRELKHMRKRLLKRVNEIERTLNWREG